MVALHSSRSAPAASSAHGHALQREEEQSYLALVEVEERPAYRTGRRDALPEHTRYVDTGCDIHPSCLSCPLVRCRYDEPGGTRKINSRVRDDTILRVRRDEKLTVEAIARRVGVSRRTVFRVLAKAREDASERDPGEV
jgi:hypothetical protein